MFSVLITSYHIGEYKPTLYVNIPAGYVGCVNLFNVETDNLDDVEVSRYGIGYIPYGKEYHLRLKYGGKKSPKILNTGNGHEVQFKNSNNTRSHWTYVACYKVGPEVDYEADHYVPRDYKPCMDGRELRLLMKLGQIDSTRVTWSFFNRTTNEYYEP